MSTTSQALSPALSGAAAQAKTTADNRFNIVELTRFAVVAFQLGLAVVLVRRFELEGKAFMYLMALAFGGFLINHLLPQRFRLAWFALVSVTGIGLVIGPLHAAWIVGLGLGLIGIAHLPFKLSVRLVILAVVVGLLAMFRGNALPSSIPPLIWPLLGSMFMFRYIVYLYDVENKSAPVSFFHAVGYFFLLPNVSFTLFPIVDYQTFAKGHYDADPIKIYQRGVLSVWRGLMQFLIYRIIYQNFLLDPATIDDLGDVWQHCMTTFGLYFKVVGSYSVIAGMIQLFGFNLPAPNHNFLLSTSFTDVWRRTNIYWKDFIQRIFFQPAYMLLNRHMPNMRAMGLATLYSFIITWLLHSYQWFWIRAAFPITWQDLVMWTWLGIGVFAAMWLEVKRPKKKSLKKVVRTRKDDVIRALKNIGMIGWLCIMWTLVWTSPSWGDTQTLLKAATNVSLSNVAFVLGSLLIFAVVTTVASKLPNEAPDASGPVKGKLDPKIFWRKSAASIGTTLVVIFIGYNPQVFAFQPKLAEVADRARSNKLSERDASLLKQGYYEDLSDATRFSPELAALYAARPKDWDVNTLVNQVEDFPDYGLYASRTIKFKGATFSTNRWGMRDQDYEKDKAPGTYRIGVFGQSVEQGSGVDDGEAYESVLENLLNKDKLGKEPKPGAGPAKHYEVLNFANGGYGPIRKMAQIERTGFGFGLDAIIYASISDLEWAGIEMVSEQEQKNPKKRIPFAELNAFRTQAGVDDSMPKVVAEQKLRPHVEAILTTVYKRIVEQCRARGVRPFYIMLAQPEKPAPELAAMMEHEMNLAKKAGFEVIDMRDAYAGVPDVEKLWLARYDHHPNEEAHRMIGQKLYDRLVKLLGI